MTEAWPWLALAGLGAFHGLNPAMGWLFAVALGLHRKSRAVVLLSLLPIAAAAGPAGQIAVALAGVGMHTLAMLVTTTAMAVLVYEWLGVAILRRAWLNVDLVWTVALVVTGTILLIA